MGIKIEEELLDENSSHSGGPQETQEIKVDNLHFPLGEVSQNGNKPSTSSPTAEEDLDLDALRLDQNFGTIIGAKQVLGVVKVRNPNKQEWFRVHPSEEFRLQTAILQLKNEGEAYLIDRSLWEIVWDEIQPVMLFTAINRQGDVFVWAVRLPKGDGRTDQFMESDMVAATKAEKQWTRRTWVPEGRTHRILVATNLSEEPAWPDISFQKILKIAFKDSYIQNQNHPVLNRLRGDE